MSRTSGIGTLRIGPLTIDFDQKVTLLETYQSTWKLLPFSKYYWGININITF